MQTLSDCGRCAYANDSTGNDYMYHLRLKSQRCRSLQPSPSLLFSYQFSVHSFTYCMDASEMQLIHLNVQSGNIERRKFTPFPITLQLTIGSPLSRWNKIRWNLKHFIYGMFRCDFTHYFLHTLHTKGKENYDKCTIERTTHHRFTNLFTFVRN